MIAFQFESTVQGGFLGKGEVDASVKPFLERSVQLHQVHGATVGLLKNPNEIEKIRGSEGDALVTHLRNVPLAIRTADCVPLLLAHPAGLIAAVHAGWRGVVSGVVSRTLACLDEALGAESIRETRIALGPAICQKCFEIGPEVAEQFRPLIKTADGLVKKGDRFQLDLKSVILQQLATTGIPNSRIENHRICTRCHQNRYYSFRGATQSGAKNDGRNLSWIVRVA